MERNDKAAWNRTKDEHGISPSNGWTNGTDQFHFGTIPPSIRQLSTRQLEGAPTDRRICLQQWISSKDQTHTLLCKLRSQPRILNHRGTPNARKNHATRRHESITRYLASGNDESATQTQGILRRGKKARSESTIRRYGLVITKKNTDEKAMKETRVQENRTFQNLGNNRRKRLEAQSSAFDEDSQHSPHLSS